jgi:hypothetical protein
MDDAHRIGGHAGARSRGAVQDRARDCRPVDGRARRDASRSLGTLLAEVSRDLLGTPIEYTDAELTRILSPRHFVDVRRTHGGPAPDETARAATASRQLLEVDESWWTNATTALAAAERRLADESAAL